MVGWVVAKVVARLTVNAQMPLSCKEQLLTSFVTWAKEGCTVTQRSLSCDPMAVSVQISELGDAGFEKAYSNN